MRGLVIKSTGSWYAVKTDDGNIVECKIKGNFRLKGIRSTNPVAVGDYVDIILNNEGTAFISEIEDRKNYVIRKSTNLSKQSHILAANVDQNYLIVTGFRPETSTTFIDRFLASSEAYDIPTHLIFNKMDSYSDEEEDIVEGMLSIYTDIGYTCHKISALTGDGLDEIKEQLKGKVTLFSGNSGVGKSTLINALIPACHQKTANISSAFLRGIHTTTYSEMFEIPDNGYIIDTPGIKGFGTFDFKDEEVGHYFPEIFETSKDCKYNNCTHTHEPGCAVLKAVEDHKISLTRYTSYLSILGDKDEGKYRAPY